MKLYVAYSTVDYEGGSVHGVFSTRKLAEEALERSKKTHNADHRYVEEVELDADVVHGGFSV